ncbi:MAG: lysophospholipid acyltransferase family protein [Magnetovibrio sp.]|nr:lysophospholipid acyltransferase family protein [Magnetovibrio sp.]
MKSAKQILKSDGLRRVLCWIGAQFIRLVRLSGRWETVGAEIPERFWREGKPFILCFWHGRLLMMPYCWQRSKPIHMLISQHRDGQLIARTVAHFGIDTVAGSTSRGGAQALRQMVKALNGGDYVGITPDGPRGPRMRASDGIVSVARLAGVPIIPATYSINRGRVLGSWDRFLVAWPFGRGVVVWGDPIEVPRQADADTLEAARQRVETSLNAITEKADRLVGRAPVEPDSLPATDASGGLAT